MSHYVAGYSKGHSRRLLRQKRPTLAISDDPIPTKKPRLVSINNNQMMDDLADEPISISPPNTNFPHPYHDSSDESDNESLERHLRIIKDEDIEKFDLKECVTDEDSSDDDVPNLEIKEPEIVTKVRKWAVMFRASHKSLNSLLTILRETFGNQFPKCAQTLLRTPRGKVVPIVVEPGLYYQFGIEMGLLHYPLHILVKLKIIIIDIGTDGFQMANSSKTVGWPILGYIVGTDLDPFLIGLYIGKEKPKSIDEFMSHFCNVQLWQWRNKHSRWSWGCNEDTH